MNIRKTTSVLLAAVLLVFACAGCGDVSSAPASSAAISSQAASPAPDEPGPLTVTDMTGREIVLEKPAARIVALSASDCEILYAIGAGDTLVGRGTYCNYPEEVLSVTEVESGAGMNTEQVIALRPEVLLMTKMAQTEEQVQVLEDAGIRVIVSDAQDIAGVYEAIELIGAITGKTGEAGKVVAGMMQSFAEVEEMAAKDGGETVYFEVSPLEYGLWTAGSGTFMDELAAMLGLTNAFADVHGWGEVSEEQVIERDPDYIVTITMYFGEGPTPVEEITTRAGWQNIRAVQNGNVFNADNDEISRPGPRLADAAAALYAFVYEEDEPQSAA